VSKEYVYGVYCAVVGDYLFAQDGYDNTILYRANKATMEVTKSVVVGWQSLLYQKDNTRLFLWGQDFTTSDVIIHIYSTEMVELGTIDIPYPWLEQEKFVAVGDKVYVYWGETLNDDPYGYVDTIRVYNLDGSYTDYSGEPWNGGDPPPKYRSLILAAAGSGIKAAGGYPTIFARTVGGVPRNVLGYGSDIVSHWYEPIPGAFDPNPRRVSTTDFTTVTVAQKEYINPYAGFRALFGLSHGTDYYAFMPNAEHISGWEGALWTGGSPTSYSIFKYDAETMELDSWVQAASTQVAISENYMAAYTDGVYAWGLSVSSEPIQVRLSDYSFVSHLWRRVGQSNAVWYQGL
jgi:hypothetical protein